MGTLGATIERVRYLVNDTATNPDGSQRPDKKFTDEQIVTETKRVLQDYFDKSREVFYPKTLSVLATIVTLQTEKIYDNSTPPLVVNNGLDAPMPIGDQFLDAVELQISKNLEGTNQAGVNPSVLQQIIDANTGER